MSEIIITDRALESAAAEYRDAMLGALPKPSECEHEFSAEYVQKRDELILRTHRRSTIGRYMRNVAAVFIVLILGSGAFLGVNGEARADFLAWARSLYENSIIYRYSGESESAPLPYCELIWVPEGYELVTSERDEDSHIMVYENELSKQLIFTCNRMTEYSLMQVGLTDVHTSTKLELNAYDAELFKFEDESLALIWLDSDNGFIYTINAESISEDVIMHIFDDIKYTK